MSRSSRPPSRRDGESSYAPVVLAAERLRHVLASPEVSGRSDLDSLGAGATEAHGSIPPLHVGVLGRVWIAAVTDEEGRAVRLACRPRVGDEIRVPRPALMTADGTSVPPLDAQRFRDHWSSSMP